MPLTDKEKEELCNIRVPAPTREERLEKALRELCERVRNYAESGCIEGFSYDCELDRLRKPSLADYLDLAEEALGK